MERILAGRYELEVPLGRGGSGEVWRGRDLATRRPVAIKIVELAQIDDPGLLAETIGRFRREANVIAGLRHPNIVGSLDAGRVGNQLFMVMELAPGVSLAAMMDERGARRTGLFPVPSVLRIAEQVSAGLAAVHEAGVVHRDIKPSNLMATPRLDVKIIDFGIVRLLTDNSPRLTLRGHTVGTLAYMSPEQAQADEVDGRADLYSLGCVLYHLLSGRMPFRSSLPAALLMMQVMDQAIPLSSFRSDLPPELAELVSDLMEKDRAARPPDATQVLRRLAAIGDSLGPDEPAREADRQTAWAGDQTAWPGGEPEAAALTRRDSGTDSGRSAVLTPERLAGLTEVTAGPPAEGAVDAPARDTVNVPPWEAGGAAAPRPPAPAPPVPPAGAGNSDGAPAWPAPRRRRRRWSGVLATLLTVAIAAGVWVYVWDRAHDKLRITSVSVRQATASSLCAGTTDIIGTIATNGRGGPITYQWISGTQSNPAAQVADDVSGSRTVQVRLRWAFHGKGSGRAVAELRVLAPQQASDSVTFPYACPA